MPRYDSEHPPKVGYSTPMSRGQNLTTVQKRKRDHDPAPPDYTKPSAVFRPGKPRTHTLSIALPGSIIAKCARRPHLRAPAPPPS